MLQNRLMVVLCLLVFASTTWAVSIPLYAFSAGYDSPGGTRATLTVNGVDYSINARGLNFVVVDQNTGIVLTSIRYDTHLSTANTDSMVGFINSLPVGRIVLVAVQDEATQSMTSAGINALLSLGASSFNPGYRGSWALIGIKGAPQGSMPQATGARYANGVSVSYNLEVIPEPSTVLCCLLGLFAVFWRKSHATK